MSEKELQEKIKELEESNRKLREDLEKKRKLRKLQSKIDEIETGIFRKEELEFLLQVCKKAKRLAEFGISPISIGDKMFIECLIKKLCKCAIKKN